VNTSRSKADWEAIEREYRAGQLSIREIGRKHGVSDTAVRKEAKARGWVRGEAAPVRTEGSRANRSEPTGGEQSRDHLYKPGESGNPKGRPKGSRNKLGEDFIQKLYADFHEHGEAVIEAVRVEKPDQYLKVVASILPKEVKISTEVDLSDEELDQRIRQLAAALDLAIGGEGGTREAAGGAAAEERPQPLGAVPAVH